MCVKRTGHHRAKLDRHDFRGIFLGYSATDHNICNIDLDSAIVKLSHHVVFDEAWYTCVSNQPPAAQFLYELGLVNDTDSVSTLLHHDSALKDPFDKFTIPIPATLPLRRLSTRHSVGATAAKLATPTPHSILDEFEIDKDVMANVYLSPDPYNYSFPETLNLRRFDSTKHPTASMNFITTDDRVFLGSMAKSTPAAKIPRWRSRLRQAWLIKINDTPISSIADVRKCLADLDRSNATKCTLLFSHPEVKHGLTNGGIP